MISRIEFCGTMGHSPIKPELSRKNRDQWDTYTYEVEGHDGRLIRQGGDNPTSKMHSNQGDTRMLVAIWYCMHFKWQLSH
jgi:hypothetical protein